MARNLNYPRAMESMPSNDRRLRKTQAQLRNMRQHSAARQARALERRRVEDEIREQRHDDCAKTICAGTFTEQRRFRSEAELMAQRVEWQRPLLRKHRTKIRSR
jgi:hypothetical protein